MFKVFVILLIGFRLFSQQIWGKMSLSKRQVLWKLLDGKLLTFQGDPLYGSWMGLKGVLADCSALALAPCITFLQHPTCVSGFSRCSLQGALSPQHDESL